MKFSIQTAAVIVLHQLAYVTPSKLHNLSTNLRGRELSDGSCFGCSDGDINPCSPLHTSGLYFYPRCNDRSKFVQCGNQGQCFVQPCPPGLHWNADTLACGFPQATEVPSAKPSAKPSSKPSAAPSTAPSLAPSSSPSTSCFECDGRNPCEFAVANNEFYYPNCDTDKYVQCSEFGQCFEHVCPTSTQWDNDKRACTHVP